jgi:5-(carboxyamino)imidazole ribonucleotide synthase
VTSGVEGEAPTGRAGEATVPYIAPGATLGVIGGGQLGRMFVHAAQSMGYRTAVLDPDPLSPAGLVAHEHIRAAYLDPLALDRLGERCAAITIEFENVPAAALRRLAERRPLAPAAAAVSVCQDRGAEKAAFARSGVACAPHASIAGARDVERVADALLPGILKTARLGYDGKGQQHVVDRAGLAPAFAALGGVPCVLEKRLPLAAEISVVVARNASGDVVYLPVQDNAHVAASSRSRACRRGRASPTGRRPRRSRSRPGSPRRSTTSASCASSSSSSPTARWSPTRWRRGRTTRGTTASTPATSRSSSCRCGR